MPESYGMNVHRWETGHEEWKLSARNGQHGFVAHRRDGKGTALVARTLDELAAKVKAEGEAGD